MDSLGGMVIFARVVQHGSFSAAARALGLPKSTVSRQVARLEDHLGVRLIQRTTRTLRLTDVGRAYHERVQRILAEVTEAEQAVTQLEAAPRGLLRVTGPLTFGTLFLGDAIAAFMGRYPEVRLDVVLTDRVVDLVEEGFDLAVRAGMMRDSSLIARRLGSASRVVCASPGYLAARGVPQTPADLARHDCLLYSYESSGSAWRLDGESSPTLSGPLISNNGDVMRKAALADQGLCFVPRFLVGPDLDAGRLVPVLQDFVVDSGGVYAVYAHSRYLSSKVRAFVDHLVEFFGPTPIWERCGSGDTAQRTSE